MNDASQRDGTRFNRAGEVELETRTLRHCDPHLLRHRRYIRDRADDLLERHDMIRSAARTAVPEINFILSWSSLMMR